MLVWAVKEMEMGLEEMMQGQGQGKTLLEREMEMEANLMMVGQMVLEIASDRENNPIVCIENQMISHDDYDYDDSSIILITRHLLYCKLFINSFFSSPLFIPTSLPLFTFTANSPLSSHVFSPFPSPLPPPPPSHLL